MGETITARTLGDAAQKYPGEPAPLVRCHLCSVSRKPWMMRRVPLNPSAYLHTRQPLCPDCYERWFARQPVRR